MLDSHLVYVKSRTLKSLRGKTSQESLAAKAGVSLRTLQSMEGVVRGPARARFVYSNVKAVAEALSVAPQELVDDVGAAPSSPEHGEQSVAESDELIRLNRELRFALSEQSPLKARAKMLEISHALALDNRVNRIDGAARLFSRVQSGLADLEPAYDQRLRYRQLATSTLQARYDTAKDPLDLVTLADSVVDMYFEGFETLRTGSILKMIAKTLKSLRSLEGNLVGDPDKVNLRVLLVTQAASLHRCAALSFGSKDQRVSRIRTSWRCAEKARMLAPTNPLALLSSGQAAWSHASSVAERSSEFLKTAEARLRDAAVSEFSLAFLVLARFLRQTYQQPLAVEAFRQYEKSETARRRVLSEAHILGEAAWQLWMSNGDAARGEVSYARDLMAEALEAGYNNARNVIDLAFLEGILGDVDSATTLLARLQLGADPAQEPPAWEDLIGTALQYAEVGDVDALRRMFTFGFDQGANWNSLGTFVLEYLNDDRLALRLYDVGLKLSPRSHVLWINKARVLDRLGRNGEGAYCRNNARRFAPQVFMPFIDELR